MPHARLRYLRFKNPIAARKNSPFFCPRSLSASLTGDRLWSEFVADAFIRQFYGVEYEFASEEIGPAKAHRFSQHSIYLGQGKLTTVRQPAPCSVTLALREKKIVGS